jgi:hypothetical protein
MTEGCIGIGNPAAAAKVSAHVIGEEDSDSDKIGLSAYSVSSIDLTDGREFCVGRRGSLKSIITTAKVAMRSYLSRSSKPRSTTSSDAPVTDARRVSRFSTPLHRAWYKERGGWRWVERDVGEVMTELRKLQ